MTELRAVLRFLRGSLVFATSALLLVVAGPATVVPADSGQIAAVRARAQAAADRFAEAETAAGVLEADLERLRSEVSDVQGRYQLLAESMSDVALSRYVNFGEELTLFANQDVYRQARGDALARLVTRTGRDETDKLQAARQDLQIKRSEYARRLLSQKAVNQQLEADQADVRAELRNLEVLEAARQAEEERAANSRAATAGSATSSGTSGARSSARVITRGSWSCPVAGSTVFSDTWGEPRSDGRWHKGVDMFADYGVPVVAVVSGTVEDNTGGAGGIAAYLYGEDGHRYYYAHLQSLDVTGAVSGGQVIGSVGDTGNSAGTPHLHFEFHPGAGSAVNPYPIVSGHC